MRKFLFLVLLGIFVSCSTIKNSSSVHQENQLFISRRYIGNFIAYYHTGTQVIGNVDLIWIRTTVYNTYGKLSAYGTTCEFAVGDKIYLKSTSTPGKSNDWEYQIENDSSISYRVSEYRFANFVFYKSRTL
jgi:hypothetical protein